MSTRQDKSTLDHSFLIKNGTLTKKDIQSIVSHAIACAKASYFPLPSSQKTGKDGFKKSHMNRQCPMCGTIVGSVGTNFRRHLNCCCPLVYDALMKESNGKYFSNIVTLKKSGLVEKFKAMKPEEYLKLVRKVLKAQPSQEKNLKRRKEPLSLSDPVVSGIETQKPPHEEETMEPDEDSFKEDAEEEAPPPKRAARRKRKRRENTDDDSSEEGNDAAENDSPVEEHVPKKRKRRRIATGAAAIAPTPAPAVVTETASVASVQPSPMEATISDEAIASALARFRAQERIQQRRIHERRLEFQRTMQEYARRSLREHLEEHPFSQDNLMNILREAKDQTHIANDNLLKELVRPQRVQDMRASLGKSELHLKANEQLFQRYLHKDMELDCARDLSAPTPKEEHDAATDPEQKPRRSNTTNLYEIPRKTT